MRITPLDVRKQEFNKSMRGFDCDEVRVFLNTLADEYETVLIDNKLIRERIVEQDEKISEYQNMERTLRDTLMTAERVMQDTRDTAAREGDVIIQEAQLKAKSILEECRLRTEELRREIIGLRKEKETYLARFRGLAEAQIQFIDTHESDFEDLDKRLVDIVDTVVTSAIIKETNAPQAPTLRSATPPANHVPGIAAANTSPGRSAPVSNDAAATVDGPEVAPVPTPAPVKAENDIWRDYHPNHEDSTEAPATTSSSVPAAEESTADAVGNIADILSESLAETSSPAAAVEIVPEPLNIDVISNGEAEPDKKTESRDGIAVEPVNI